MTHPHRAPRRLLLAAAFAASLAACSSMPGMRTSMPVKAQLDGQQEVPPVSTSGTGRLEGSLDKDTNVFKWKVTHSGLSGPATAGHIHGPASRGQNAGVVIPFGNAASPIEGQQKLTAAQVEDLMAGRWYANIHTAAHPAGEIRGQLMVGK